MGFYDVLRDVSKDAGISFAGIAESMGRNRNYVTNNASRGSAPNVDNAAAMLAACGYELCAVPRGSVPPGALVVEPPARDGEAERRALERRRDKLRRELAAVDERLIG